MSEDKKPSALIKLAESYEDNPVVRALVQLVIAPVPYGVGSAIDSALTKTVENMREERVRSFFDELASGTRELSGETIAQDNFLHAYFATVKAAMGTRRTEKIRLFARLLIQATNMGQVGSSTHEEFLAILDDLSFREMQLLQILRSLENRNPPMLDEEDRELGLIENDLSRVNSYWDEFEEVAQEQLGIDPSNLSSICTRLNRTGLYKTLVGTYVRYQGDRGITTPLFSEFTMWLGESVSESG